jgi:threonine aldolase
MNFNSDNVAGASAPVLDAVVKASQGPEAAYGTDAWTRRAEVLLREMFETDCAVFLVATGTAANALALAAMAPPWGGVFCHAQAHVNLDECGAPEMFSAGAKLIGLPGEGGKLSAATLTRALAAAARNTQQVKPAAVSISNLTECGLVYTPGEIRAVAEVAHAAGLALHMDGARFANAVVASNASPAELTWRAGVDILTFGATKNGALSAEAILVFEPRLAADLHFRRKRSGHLLSKGRLLGAQWVGHLEHGHWLDCARHANACAARLSAGLAALPGVTLQWPTHGNEVFPVMPRALASRIQAAGFQFRPWVKDAFAEELPPEQELYRLVCAFDTRMEDVEALLQAAR